MEIVNLTPHTVRVYQDDVVVAEVASSGFARCAENRRSGKPILVNGAMVPSDEVGFGKVTGLPAPARDTIYVVSRATAEAVPGRTDVVYPDDIVRDGTGQILGCRKLSRPASR